MKELVFATNNKHKLFEIQNALGDEFTIKSLYALNFSEEIPEPYETIEENARAKSTFINEKFSVDCFADDTGLEIEALDGKPGVYAARFAGENCTFDDNMNKVLRLMDGVENRNAKFRTIISLILKGKEYQFEGFVEGEILSDKSGDEGFGYDPIFKPNGYKISFAEMPIEEKNKISHRGLATKKLIGFLKSFQF